jgi:DUF4097 and DUF4098 domain-containing protein YvlB
MAELLERTTPATVRISSTGGRLTIVAEGDGPVAFDGRAQITHVDGVATIDAGSNSVRVTVPEGADLMVGATSGRIEITGRAGDVAIVGRSGRVSLESATSVDVRSSSGRVEIGHVAGDCCVRSSSGRVVVGSCGSADVAAKSGLVRVKEAHGPARVHCVSGRITVNLAIAADVAAETVSGRIEVSVPAGVRVHRTSTIDDPTPRPPGTDCTVAARSVTGRVVVTSRG